MDPGTRTLLQVTLDDAAVADEIFSTLMGEDVESRRSFIQKNAEDVRFLDIKDTRIDDIDTSTRLAETQANDR